MTNDNTFCSLSNIRSPQNRFFRAKEIHCYNAQADTKLTQIFIRNPPFTNYSEKRKWENFPHMFGNLEGIRWILVIYVKRSPLIGGNAQMSSHVIFFKQLTAIKMYALSCAFCRKTTWFAIFKIRHLPGSI
jgi:hypothetical protein